MIVLDGSQGEGGGQILRTSLALSMVTAQPFRIENIRAGRAKPGILRQHLTAIQAATEVSGAEVDGASIGSRELSFRPRAIRSGRYHLAVGTAGSTTLVLQTVLPALLLAREPSELSLEGGTHNPMAPPHDFLVRSFLPLLRRMGSDVAVRLERPGFYPAGGGRLHVAIAPCPRLQPLEILERGPVSLRGTALVANLPLSIAERELDAIARHLRIPADRLRAEDLQGSAGPGNVVMVDIESAGHTEVFTGFGEKGRPAEAVAEHVARETRAYLDVDAPVGPHLADQLLIPLAMAGGGRFRTGPPTRHTLTNVEIVRRFLRVPLSVEEEWNRVWEIAAG